MIKKSLAITFLLLLAGFAVWNFAMHKEAEIGIEKGEKAPDFTLPSLKGGEDVSLSDFKGKKCCSIFGRRGASLAELRCPICSSFKMSIGI